MNWGFNRTIYAEYGMAIPIKLDIATHIHALLTGSSGSGKSYALLYLLGMLLKMGIKVKLFFCDFKNSEDFSFIKDYEHYYSGNDCYKGIMEYYRLFSDVRINGITDTTHILICDEYPAFINYLQMRDKLDKTKLATDILGAISEILMLGRGIKFGVWLVTQRADSSLFNNGARDNFMVLIGLGRLSREQKGMIFTGEELPDRIYKQGEGILLADSHELQEVKFPRINNIPFWKDQIHKAIKR